MALALRSCAQLGFIDVFVALRVQVPNLHILSETVPYITTIRKTGYLTIVLWTLTVEFRVLIRLLHGVAGWLKGFEGFAPN